MMFNTVKFLLIKIESAIKKIVRISTKIVFEVLHIALKLFSDFTKEENVTNEEPRTAP